MNTISRWANVVLSLILLLMVVDASLCASRASVCLFCTFWFLSFSSFWCQGLDAACDRDTPWTFLLFVWNDTWWLGRQWPFNSWVYVHLWAFNVPTQIMHKRWSSLWWLSPVKRICVFEHSVMTNFNCACPTIQRGQGSGFLSEGSSWLTACMSEQRRFWRDCADAQARLNLRCSHRRLPNSLDVVHISGRDRQGTWRAVDARNGMLFKFIAKSSFF